jgi:2-haloacid dehalogenase
MATLLFDTWGTLVDNYSIADVLEPHFLESHTAQTVSEDWRFMQKWSMFYVTLCERFIPQPGLTEASLRWALDTHGIELEESNIQDIMSQYHKLRAYPDVPKALKALKAQGHTIKIVANPTKKMLEAVTEYAGIRQDIDEIISSGDECKAFKPSPKVFQLGIERAGCPKEDIIWVAGHFWEIVGADTQGLATAWTNRQRIKPLPIGVTPTYTLPHLQALADALEGSAKRAGAVS